MAGAIVIPFPLANNVRLPLVLAVPPVQGAGAIKFGRVFLSIATGNYELAPLPDSVMFGLRIIDYFGNSRVFENVVVPRGRRFAIELQPTDSCVIVAPFEINGPGEVHSGIWADGSVMIEYE